MSPPDELDSDDQSEELLGAEEEEGFSLEELSETYAHLFRAEEEIPAGPGSHRDSLQGSADAADDEARAVDDACPVTPRSIVEAVMWVGRPDNSPIAAAEIARLMRGVQTAEVIELVAELNAEYAELGRAFRIVDTGTGYRMQLAEDLSFITDLFYGRAKPIRLNQAAVDVLALVAYQPGISREMLDEQRGENSSGLLNQLVRRQLLEMRREGDSGRVPCYYPTERLLELAGLGSLEDLPQAEDWD